MKIRHFLLLLLFAALQGNAHSSTQEYTLEMAKQDAAKSLTYIDQGKFERALIVPIERFPQRYAKALKTQQSDENLALVLLKSNLKATSSWMGPRKNRKYIEARRIDFPLFSDTPTYRVLFESTCPRGKIEESVVISFKTPTGKDKKAHLRYNYNFRKK